MADYWKSQGRHFCDFCKCWTADNKASIEFHERGKNHQGNVKRRLSEIKKKSIDKRKNDEANKKMFEQMEKAALAAVQKDMNTETSTVGRSDLKNIVKANATSENSSTYPWTAMKAPQGFTYYYNSLTGASTWEMPEVFKQLGKEKTKEKAEEVKKPVQKRERTPPPPAVVEEVHSIHPLLGGWTTVTTHHEQQQSSEVEKADEATEEEKETSEKTKPKEGEKVVPTKRFKEKTLKAMSTEESADAKPVAFKKRKGGNRNVRKRCDDD